MAVAETLVTGEDRAGRVYHDVHGCRDAVRQAVVGQKSEYGVAREVRVRPVRKSARIRIEADQLPVCGPGDNLERDRVAVDVSGGQRRGGGGIHWCRKIQVRSRRRWIENRARDSLFMRNNVESPAKERSEIMAVLIGQAKRPHPVERFAAQRRQRSSWPKGTGEGRRS